MQQRVLLFVTNHNATYNSSLVSFCDSLAHARLVSVRLTQIRFRTTRFLVRKLPALTDGAYAVNLSPLLVTSHIEPSSLHAQDSL